jgi:hypothetical protein
MYGRKLAVWFKGCTLGGASSDMTQAGVFVVVGDHRQVVAGVCLCSGDQQGQQIHDIYVRGVLLDI